MQNPCGHHCCWSQRLTLAGRKEWNREGREEATWSDGGGGGKEEGLRGRKGRESGS